MAPEPPVVDDTADDTGVVVAPRACGTDAAVASSPPYAGRRAGSAVALADLTRDGSVDLIVNASTPIQWDTLPGQVYVVPGATAGDVLLDPHLLELRPPQTHEVGFGYALAAGDATGDGHPELLVGAPWITPEWSGRAWLLGGPLPRAGVHDPADHALAIVHGEWGGLTGSTVAILDDLTGSGSPTWAVGSYLSSFLDQPDVIDLFDGSARGDLTLADATARLTLGAPKTGLAALAPHSLDQDGDGVPELVVSAYLEPQHARIDHLGALYRVSAPLVGRVDLRDGEQRLGVWHEGNLGASMSHGDLDGDGYADLVVGAMLDGNDAVRAGRVYLLHGPDFGAGPIDDGTSWIGGAKAYDQLGAAVEVIGDVDGDGVDDLAVSVIHNSWFQFEPGEVLVFAGPLRGVLHPDDAVWRWDSGCAADTLGLDLASADVDGDGRVDLLVGAPNANLAVPGSGGAYLILGSTMGW